MAIIVASPLTQNIYDRIGAHVIEKYYEVAIIDCLAWERKYDENLVYKEIEAANIHAVNSMSTFREVFKLISPSFVLDFVGRGEHTRIIQDITKEFGAIYITHLLTPFPNPISGRTVLRSMLVAPLVTSHKIIHFILRRFFEDKPLPPDVALLAGSESSNTWAGTARQKIFTATPDYFNLYQIRKSAAANNIDPPLPKGDYILFIDDCLALSFDFIIGPHKSVFESDEYFSLLKEVFLRLEDYFKMPVVVAAHPNGKEFNGYQALFGERIVLFDATGKLSLNCHFAMTHYSSAISYPVLLRKPLLLLNSRKLKKQPQGIAINYIAGALQCPQIEMEQDLGTNELTKISNSPVIETCYKSYEEKYIKNVKIMDTNPFESLLRYLSSLD